jgi:uncharacterized protein YndB with AHSA1/START domain
MRCATKEDPVKTYQARTTIDAPSQTVFDYVSDFMKHGEWAGHGLQVMKDTDGPVAVGSTFSTVAKQFGTQREHSTVTELDPGRLFGWESKGVLGTVHHWFTVAATDGGTSLTKSAEFLDRSFLAKMTGWKIARDVPAGLKADVEKIRARLEAPSG